MLIWNKEKMFGNVSQHIYIVMTREFPKAQFDIAYMGWCNKSITINDQNEPINCGKVSSKILASLFFEYIELWINSTQSDYF